MPYKKKISITLIELLVVIVIVGVLATLGLYQYGSVKEGAVDKEAIANLKIIQAAEKIYRIENTRYYPYAGGSESDITKINPDLKLSLSAGANWTYTIYGNASGCSSATRIFAGSTRTWVFKSANNNEPNQTDVCP